LDNFFSEEELKALFGEKREEKSDKEKEDEIPVMIQPQKMMKKEKNFRQLFLKFAVLFVVIFMISFAIINISALTQEFRYFWDVKIRGGNYNRSLIAPSPQNQPAFNPTAVAKLVIPKIGVSAPILWNVPEEEINDKLLEGIVHYQGTALHRSTGNIFMTGHSSYYQWVSSPYKDVFALLEKVTPGDKVYIQYTNTTLTYEVSNTKVVSPNEISVMDQIGENRLTLMSCVPVGTNISRLIVTALPVGN